MLCSRRYLCTCYDFTVLPHCELYILMGGYDHDHVYSSTRCSFFECPNRVAVISVLLIYLGLVLNHFYGLTEGFTLFMKTGRVSHHVLQSRVDAWTTGQRFKFLLPGGLHHN